MKRELIIHVWAEYNGTYRIEDNTDEVLADDFETPEEAYQYAVKHYPKATIYRYNG